MKNIKFNLTKHSVIPKGVLHKDLHSIHEDSEMGRKGIPIASCSIDEGCEKVAEVEKEELTVPKERSQIIEKLAYVYLESKDPLDAFKLGLFMHNEITTNTKDFTKAFLRYSGGKAKVKSTTAPKS